MMLRHQLQRPSKLGLSNSKATYHLWKWRLMIRQFLIESLVRLLEAHLEALESAEKLDFRWVVIFCFPDCKTSLYCRRVNVSHFGDPSQCWNELLTQRTYVILLQPHYGHHQLLHDALFKARYDDPLGAAIEFTTETERKLQKALGNNFPLLLQQNYSILFFDSSLICSHFSFP